MEGKSTAKIKVTNRQQFSKLVEEMEKNPDIARGYPDVGKTKGDIKEFWRKLTLLLNALGPPTKESLEWRRVWNDYKRNLKQKIAKNKMEIQGTGGGQNTQYSLNAIEEQVDAIVNLTKSGAPSGRSFGVPNCESDRCESDNLQMDLDDIVEIPLTSHHFDNNVIINPDQDIIGENIDIDQRPTENETPPINRPNPKPINKSKYEIEKQRIQLLEQQTKKHNETVKILQKIEKNTYNMQRYLKKSYELKVKKIKLLEEQAIRQHKNELQKQKLLYQKLKIKKRVLAIEKKKLGIDNDSSSELED